MATTPGATEDIPMEANIQAEVDTKNDDKLAKGQKKFFANKKLKGIDKKAFKGIPNSVKKKRVNFRLRKMVAPKSAIMILNEMVGAVNYRFMETPAHLMPMASYMPPQQTMVTAQCTLDGHTFTDTGPTKSVAKNLCAERAIQFVVSKKCSSNSLATSPEIPPQERIDETPWAQLASLGLYKMFHDWQARGWVMPKELRTGSETAGLMKMEATPGTAADPSLPMDIPTDPSATPSEGGDSQATPQPRKKLPPNPTERHPVQLLNEMRGPVVFNVMEQKGVSPNISFVMGVEIDGKSFQGEGRNKKDAKKFCAINVLKDLYQIVYPEVTASE